MRDFERQSGRENERLTSRAYSRLGGNAGRTNRQPDGGRIDGEAKRQRPERREEGVRLEREGNPKVNGGFMFFLKSALCVWRLKNMN